MDGALQAQDYPQALWAIGLRMHSATLADVEQALNAGRSAHLADAGTSTLCRRKMRAGC